MPQDGNRPYPQKPIYNISGRRHHFDRKRGTGLTQHRASELSRRKKVAGYSSMALQLLLYRVRGLFALLLTIESFGARASLGLTRQSLTLPIMLKQKLLLMNGSAFAGST